MEPNLDPRTVVGTAIDPDGRTVELTAGRWAHILDGHPELAPYQEAVLGAVSAPDHRRPGHEAGEEWCYLATARPSRWLKVVVGYEAGHGWIVTAFARRSLP